MQNKNLTINQQYVASVIKSLEPISSYQLLNCLYILYKLELSKVYLGYSSCGLKIRSKILRNIISELTQKKVISTFYGNPLLLVASENTVPKDIPESIKDIKSNSSLGTVAILLYYGGITNYQRITPQGHTQVESAVKIIDFILKNLNR